MDIRKFFGAPKPKTSASKLPVVKDKNGQKADENVKNKLSSFKKDEPSKSEKKLQSTSKTLKTTGSQGKNFNGEKEEKIVIDESSDDDIVPCSLESSLVSSKNKTPKSVSSSKKDKSVPSGSKSKSKAATKANSESSKDVQDSDISKQVKDTDKPTGKKNIPELSKKESVRTSPRKSKSVQEDTKKGTSEKKKKRQISEDESDEACIIEESSEDDEEVISSKRTNGQKRKRGKKAAQLLDSDSDEDPVPKKTPQSNRKKKSMTHVVHDSDEETSQTAIDIFLSKKSAAASLKVKAPPKKEVPKKAPVNVSDFFGTGSVAASRVERLNVTEKRKREESNSKADDSVVYEEELHDDEDFLKVLDELDGPSVKKVKVSQPEDDKEAVTGKGGSLASKLANKMKAESNTPQKVERDINKNVTSSSPTKKTHSPQKTTTTTTLKERKSYTLEVTKTNTKKESPVKVEETKVPEKTPQKPPAKVKPGSSTKKDTDKEDDGFGAKKGGGYRAFKMRGGPSALGSKEIPEGAENCLEGMTFVITGVLDSVERDDAKSMVEKHGGKVTASISKKTSYLVVGREPGDSKLAKARDLKVKQIDEDELFELVRTLPGKTSKYELQAKEQLKKEESLAGQKEKSASMKKLESFKADKDNEKVSSGKPLFTQLKNSAESQDGKSSDEVEKKQDVASSEEDSSMPSLLWVDKHKPTSLKQIIGQQGDKSNAHKLLYWIKHWHQNIIVKGLKTAGGNFFGKGGGDGTGFRAALLSGPPGIGKTTTATLVCKEAGFSFVELNASDTRSKKNLKEVVAESLNNQTLVDYFGEEKGKGGPQHSHHCMIMDEVDGMAGNEDRGGLQELVQLIKSTKIPIICICNDRNSTKMRTLANYCFDLRFQRPRVEQIKGAMMTLAFREGLKVPPAALQEIILAANHDIRQVVHNLSMWSAGDRQLTFDQVKEDAKKAQKDLRLGPFDVCRKVFVSDEETRKMSIHDKSDLFFHDYSFAPLFVHENYPHVIPSRAEGKKAKHMACLAHTIDSLCDGDLVEKLIRNGGSWNLLPTQAMFSSVIPGEIMRGSFPQMTNFPAWLGKNSSTGKTDRILQELGMHMGLKISCDKRGLNQDYLPALRMNLTAPLASHGADSVPGVIRMMDDYDIIKDDFDNILEVSKWPNSIDYMARVESKTKAALTRMYNKSGIMTPYATGAGGKKKRGRAATAGDEDDLLREEGEEEEAVVESEQEEDDEPVVVAKPKSKAAGKGKQAAGKGKGVGKGRK